MTHGLRRRRLWLWLGDHTVVRGLTIRSMDHRPTNATWRREYFLCRKTIMTDELDLCLNRRKTCYENSFDRYLKFRDNMYSTIRCVEMKVISWVKCPLLHVGTRVQVPSMTRMGQRVVGLRWSNYLVISPENFSVNVVVDPLLWNVTTPFQETLRSKRHIKDLITGYILRQRG